MCLETGKFPTKRLARDRNLSRVEKQIWRDGTLLNQFFYTQVVSKYFRFLRRGAFLAAFVHKMKASVMA